MSDVPRDLRFDTELNELGCIRGVLMDPRFWGVEYMGPSATSSTFVYAIMDQNAWGDFDPTKPGLRLPIARKSQARFSQYKRDFDSDHFPHPTLSIIDLKCEKQLLVYDSKLMVP